MSNTWSWHQKQSQFVLMGYKLSSDNANKQLILDTWNEWLHYLRKKKHSQFLCKCLLFFCIKLSIELFNHRKKLIFTACKVWGKVMYLHLCVMCIILFIGDMCLSKHAISRCTLSCRKIQVRTPQMDALFIHSSRRGILGSQCPLSLSRHPLWADTR